jgi:hypothetical protein
MGPAVWLAASDSMAIKASATIVSSGDAHPERNTLRRRGKAAVVRPW